MGMDKVKKWLTSYGFNDTEIAVYMCILAHPEIRVSDIQRETGTGRTTIYYTIAQLKSRGLLSENMQNNVKTYRAADTETLKHAIETDIAVQQDKLQQLTSLEPMFDELMSSSLQDSSYVARFEGTGPIKQAIEQAMRCDSKRWHIIASRDNFLHHCSKKYQQYYLTERKRRGITAKTLWEPTDDFAVHNLEEMFYRNPRKLPDEFRGTFNTLIIMYDQTMLIVDSYDQKTAHAIHNPTSTHFMRMLHEYVWKNAERV
jgi:sugar-specific transcriptional regulator TrmB